MADTTERSFLINTDRSTAHNGWIRKLKKRYSKSLVTSRRALLCLVWVGLGNGLKYLIAWFSWITFISSDAKHLSVYLFIIMCSYFFRPVLGYIGERYTRYNVITTGVIVSCLTSIVLLVMISLKIYGGFSNEQVNIAVLVICLFAHNVGLGFVVANIFQFSTDQDPQASSEELASFARWSVFATTSFTLSVFSITLVLLKTCSDKGTITIVVFILSLVLCMAYALFGVCFKCYFIIEPPPTVDPLKLMFQVLKYAWKHKYPERRSAFTYSDDPPSRLDFGKARYGGPFTTDQVESVKSFWYILPVILCIGVSAYQWEDLLSVQFLPRIFNETYSNSDYYHSPFQMHFSDFVLVLVPPFFQLILIPLFPCLVPGILKRIWFSILLIVVSSIVNTLVHVVPISQIDTTQSIYATIASNVFAVFGGVGSAVILFSSLEFIFAQAPITFQGLLIGIWCFCTNGKGLIFLMFVTSDTVRFCMVTSLQCVSLLVFSIVMYCYKYRLRNELSDINRRQIVEEIYERNLRKRHTMEINFNGSRREDLLIQDVN